jgi:hypothetical protein
MFFSDGKISHIACGKQVDSYCLDTILSSETLECFFIPHLKTSNVDKTNLTTEQVIKIIEDKKITVEFRSISASAVGARTPMPPEKSSPKVSGQINFFKIREGLTAALTNQVGPFGSLIIARVIEKKWGVSEPTREDIEKLIDMLKKEIEDEENQKEFLSEAKKLL